MIGALLTILPVFGLVLAGYTYRWLGIFDKSASTELNRFVVYFALPLLLLDITINATWTDWNLIKLVAAFGLSCGIIFALILVTQLVRRHSLPDAGIESLCASYPNTGYLGFPLCVIVFGNDILPAVTLLSIVSTSLLFATTIALVELGKQPEAKILPLICGVGVSVLKNPLVSAPIIGAIIGATGFTLPASVHTFLSLGSSAASPCALVALGVFLAENDNYAKKDSAGSAILIAASKLVLQPVVTFLIAYYVFALPTKLVYAATLLAALPTGTGPFMVAQLYHLEMSVTSRAIFRTTTIAIFSLSLLLYLGGQG
jgi:hypothetical protein